MDDLILATNGNGSAPAGLHPEAIARARATLAPAEQVQSMAEVFAALGDPTRLRIVGALRVGELCVQDLTVLLGLTTSAVSHQLRLLRTLRLVRARKVGRIVFYGLDDAHVADLLTQAEAHVRHR